MTTLTSRTIGALILLLRIVGNQLNFVAVHVWLRGGSRRGDGARWGKGRLAANDRALDFDPRGGGVLGHGCQHGGHDRKRGLIIRAGIPRGIGRHARRVVRRGRVAVEAKGGRVLGEVLHVYLGQVEVEVERQVGGGGGTEDGTGTVEGAGVVREGVVIGRVRIRSKG